jgi:hypothetical protein
MNNDQNRGAAVAKAFKRAVADYEIEMKIRVSRTLLLRILVEVRNVERRNVERQNVER